MDVLSPFFRLQCTCSSSFLETSYYGAYSNPNQLAGDLISHIRRIKKNTDVAVSFEWSMWIYAPKIVECVGRHSQMLLATASIQNLQALLRLRSSMAQKGDISLQKPILRPTSPLWEKVAEWVGVWHANDEVTFLDDRHIYSNVKISIVLYRFIYFLSIFLYSFLYYIYLLYIYIYIYCLYLPTKSTLQKSQHAHAQIVRKVWRSQYPIHQFGDGTMWWPLLNLAMMCLGQDVGTYVQAPLDIRYPGLVKCDPKEMYGCMTRCYSGVMTQANADRKLCATIRCVRDCSRTTPRECPSKAITACKTLLSLIDVVKSQCYLDCEQWENIGPWTYEKTLFVSSTVHVLYILDMLPAP